MAHEFLNNLLVERGEKNPDILRCTLVKFGGVALESENAPDVGEKRSEFLKALLKDLVNAVAAHPNVSAPISLDDARGTITLGKPVFLATGNRSLFHVMLPRPQLKYPGWSSGRDIEDFYVIYSGSLFAVFREVSDYAEPFGIGQEFRELLRAQIPKETSLRCSILGSDSDAARCVRCRPKTRGWL